MPLANGRSCRSVLRAARTISHCAWSPDGSAIAMALTTGDVLIWDWARQQRRHEIRLTEGTALTQVSWSPDGERLAVCEKERIFLWEPDGTVRSRELPGRIQSAAWGKEGRAIGMALLIGTSPARRLELASWDLETGRLDRLHEEWARGYCGLSSDRRWMALQRTDGHLEVWDLQTLREHEPAEALRHPCRDVSAMAVSPDQTALAVAFGGEVALWDLKTGKPRPPLGSDEHAIHSLAFSPGGELLAGKSRRGSVRLWWCKDGSERKDVEEPSIRGQSPDITFHPTEPFLATYDQWNTALRIWELEPEEIPPLTARMRKILFVSSNPQGTQPLRTDQEAREIQKKLELGRHWDRIEIQWEPAAQPQDVQAALQRHEPDIIHFAGHGDSNGSTLLEDPDGMLSLVSQHALTNVLALFSNHLECVILNICRSEVQARSISQVVEHVIGMSSTINDRSAIAFSSGFYQALGDGRSVASAYRLGCSLIDLKGLPGFDTPVLFQKGRIVPLDLPRPFEEASEPLLPEEETRPVEEEMEQLRDRFFLATVDRLLGSRGGERDRASLADLLSTELFEDSPNRDLQPAASAPGLPAANGKAAARRIWALLLEKGFEVSEEVCARDLPELAERARRLRARVPDPGGLTRSARGGCFDPSVHERAAGSTGNIVEHSLFPGHGPLKELVFTTASPG